MSRRGAIVAARLGVYCNFMVTQDPNYVGRTAPDQHRGAGVAARLGDGMQLATRLVAVMIKTCHVAHTLLRALQV